MYERAFSQYKAPCPAPYEFLIRLVIQSVRKAKVPAFKGDHHRPKNMLAKGHSFLENLVLGLKIYMPLT